MSRPVRWFCDPGKYGILRKITAVCLTVILSLTVIGLFIVIPGIKEWYRQRLKININNSDKIKDPISKGLLDFNNALVKGQINGIYITTNETNLETTNKLLKQHPFCKQAIHIGCATWHNFDIMCKRQSRYGLIVDFNPRNAEFIQKTVEIIKFSDSRYAFKTNMIAYLNSLKGNEKNLFFHVDQKGLLTERIEKELTRKGSWLENCQDYSFIKQLVSDNHIVAITEDITNDKTFSKIRRFLDCNKFSIDTVYLSNVCNFMYTENMKKAFSKSVKHLLDSDTIFISCPKIKKTANSEITILHQQPILGREILKEDFNITRLFKEYI